MATAAVVAMALPAQAAFPGGNGKIAFVRDHLGQDIYVMNADGSAQAQLTSTGRDSYPAWSADGQKIAFASTRDGTLQIYVMDADGSNQTRLTTNSEFDYDPAWSPDGQSIAFTTFRNGNHDIYVMNAVPGSVETPLTTNPGGDLDPAWSPDGTKIAFASTRDGTLEIYVMDADGSNQTRLTNDQRFSQLPAWSPDGERIAFRRHGFFGPGEIWVMDADGSSQTRLTVSTATGPTDATLAWSPDGQKIAFERIDNSSSGSRGIWTMNTDGSAQLPLSLGGDSLPDWQPLPDPIVFVHGFLGSKIVCGSDELWPHRSLRPFNFPDDGLLDMRLAADGVSNLPGTCGAQVGGIVEEVLTEDIYKSTVDFLNRVAPGRNHVFTWDWRTSPAESLAGLDGFVDNVRAQHANAKVVLMAHSMGGLLTRWYVDDQARADKVARALTIGTPYWGSPKSLFPLAAGIETPQATGLDALLNDPDLREFARNLLGLYFLWPSENYGPWLTLAPPGPGTLDRAGLLDYVGTALGGNRVLLEQALDAHANTLDGFETNGVDYRVVVGTGLNTISRVTILEEEVGIKYSTGDKTVPAVSAVQGTPGTTDPLGEDVPIYYACGVGHVPLPGHPDVDDAVEDFLLSGADIQLSAAGTPGLHSTPCPSSGFQVQIFPVQIGLRAALPAAADQPADAAGTAVPLEDAELLGLVQVLAFPNQTIIVTDAATPVELALPPGPFNLEVTPLYDEEEGPTLVYGPLDGEVTLAASETLTVFEDGEEVEPATPNQPPDCSGGVASPAMLWPPNHALASIDIQGLGDPDGDAVSVLVSGITQDEAVDAPGSGNTAPDGAGVGTVSASVRAERAGGGDGRVYAIGFTASDGRGGICTGRVQVGVPRSSNGVAVDSGQAYDSTAVR